MISLIKLCVMGILLYSRAWFLRKEVWRARLMDQLYWKNIRTGGVALLADFAIDNIEENKENEQGAYIPSQIVKLKPFIQNKKSNMKFFT